MNEEEWEDGADDSGEPVKQLVFDFVIEKGQEPYRIDKYLMNKMSNATRTKIQEAIDEGLVLVNGKSIRPNYKVKPGDHVLAYSYHIPHSEEIIPEDIPLDIVYEDESVMVVNKAWGMVVHPGHGNPNGTLVNAAAFHFQQQHLDTTELARVGMVHRIDKDTSGLLVLAKTPHAMQHLSKQFAAHTVTRLYHALVWGDPGENEGTIDTFIGRHERLRKLFDVYDADDEKGKHAITHFTVLERFHYVTLVECRLETGRTHQIRVHMKHIGHTLFNDAFYGGDRILKGTVFSKYKSFVENCFQILPRQALHAKTLGFVHPVSGEFMHFESPLPAEFEEVLNRWRNYIRSRNPLQ